MAMPPQFAKGKTPGKGMPPSKPGDKPAPGKGKKGVNPFAKKGGSAAAKTAPVKGKKGVNPFAK